MTTPSNNKNGENKFSPRPKYENIPLIKTDKIARIFQIPDGDKLNIEISAWKRIYYDKFSQYKFRNLKEERRESEKAILSIRKTLILLRNENSLIANTIRFKASDQIERRALEAMRTQQDISAVAIGFHDFLNALETATDATEQSLSFERPPLPPALPKNPGLWINLGNIERYWIERSRARNSTEYKAYWNVAHDTPGNDATRFTCLCLRLIDPSLKRSSIYSQMKKRISSSNGS